MNGDPTGRVLSAKGKRISSVSLVAFGLLAALIAVMAWPALDRIFSSDNAFTAMHEE